MSPAASFTGEKTIQPGREMFPFEGEQHRSDVLFGALDYLENLVHFDEVLHAHLVHSLRVAETQLQDVPFQGHSEVLVGFELAE